MHTKIRPDVIHILSHGLVHF